MRINEQIVGLVLRKAVDYVLALRECEKEGRSLLANFYRQELLQRIDYYDDVIGDHKFDLLRKIVLERPRERKRLSKELLWLGVPKNAVTLYSQDLVEFDKEKITELTRWTK